MFSQFTKGVLESLCHSADAPEKDHRVGFQRALVQVLILLPAHCVTLGMPPNLAEPQFPN